MHDHLALELPLSDSSSEEEASPQEGKDVEANASRKGPSTPTLEAIRPIGEADQGGHDLEKAATTRSNGHGQPVARTVTALDWTGPDDPENPHNWSLLLRSYHAFPPALFAFVTTFGTSVYTPAIAEIIEVFNISRTVAILPLTFYTLGLAFGPMISAPISETFGRRIVYRVTLPVSMLFTLGAGFSQTFVAFCVCRFFAGTAGSAVLAVGAGTNADLWPPHIRAVATSLFITCPFLGPSLGPIIGGFVAQYKDWRWTQWTTLFFGVVAYTLSIPMKETYKKSILRTRAKKLNIPGPTRGLPPGLEGVKFILTTTVLQPLHMLLMEPIVSLLSIYNAFAFAVLFSFFAAFPLIFPLVYGFSISQVGLSFLGIGVGVVFGCITCIIFDQTIYQKLHVKSVAEGRHTVAPEHRLYAAMIGSIAIPIGLFWLGWTARPEVHWISPILASIPFAWGNVSIFITSGLYLIDIYGPLNGASAMAANGILRYSAGSVFPLFIVQMYTSLGIGWATSLLGFISVAMMPIPWIFFKYGSRIRVRSKYEIQKFG
ncbi:MFS general substrate transporter [Eremomyces bilateralis CBS 781.70]|uniref:MFS general substrate transporter n=1 Tax=Eremomyces bilateralis CBS 781.70 TaxID=1392243 RepID=A0A6G1G2T7_9PEZI|nr:MFS general substrate transporter [Eremomyces bilateralis CBS 781.70]KAF1812119.1 MFS general substrate transporter [Eremomyces bilateralis CBS 781.70]